MSKYVGGKVIQFSPLRGDFTPPLPMCELGMICYPAMLGCLALYLLQIAKKEFTTNRSQTHLALWLVCLPRQSYTFNGITLASSDTVLESRIPPRRKNVSNIMTSEHFDVFLSHNNKDRDLVHELAIRLQDEASILPWLDNWVIPIGSKWKKELDRALDACNVFVAFLDEHGWSKYHLKETRVAIKRLKKDNNYRIIPVLLPGAKETDFAKVGTLFYSTQRVDFRSLDGIDDDDAFRRLATGIRGEPPFPEGHPRISVYTIRRHARRWIETGRKDKSILFNGPRLLEAQKIAKESADKITEPAQSFLEASVLEEQRSKRRLRVLTFSLGGVIILALVTALIVASLRGQLGTETIVRVTAQSEAELQARIALARELAIKSQSLGAGSETQIIQGSLLAAESLQRYPTLEGSVAAGKILSLIPKPVGQKSGMKASAIAFDPMESRVVIGTEEGVISLWDISLGQELWEMQHDRPISELVIRSDGNTLASGSPDGLILLVSLSSGKVINRIKAKDLRTLAFSLDNEYLLAASSDGVHAWDIQNAQELIFYDYPKQFPTNIRSIVVDPGFAGVALQTRSDHVELWDLTRDEMIFGSSGDGWEMANLAVSKDWELVAEGTQLTRAVPGTPSTSIVVWHIPSSEEIARISGVGEITSLEFSPNGKWIGFGGPAENEQGSVEIWNIWNALNRQSPSAELISKFLIDSPPRNIVFSPNGRNLAIIAENGDVKIREITEDGTGKIMQLAAKGQSAFISEDASLLITETLDQSIPFLLTYTIWDAQAGKDIYTFTATRYFDDAVFSPSDSSIALVSKTNSEQEAMSPKPDEILLIDLVHQTTRTVVLDAMIGAGELVYSMDGTMIIGPLRDGTVRVWEVTTGTEIVRVSHDSLIAMFGPDGIWFASGGLDGTVRVWETNTGNERAFMSHDQDEFGNPARIEALSVSPDGRWIASGATDNTSRVWDVMSGQEISRFVYDGEVSDLNFNSVGEWIVSVANDDKVTVWEAETGHAIMSFVSKDVTHANLNADNQWVATASNDTISVWDVTTGQEMNRMVLESPYATSITDIFFSPDSKLLISTSSDHSVHAWLWQPKDLISEICARMSRNLTHAEWQQYVGVEPYHVTCPEYYGPEN